MSGFFYAFGAAFFAATSDALSKKALASHPVVLTAWARLAFSSPFLLPLLYVIPIPPLDQVFWGTILLLLPLETTALILYMKALQISPLSLTVPFLALTPGFSIVTSFALLGERPDLSGLAGIFLLMVGTYLLNAHLWREGLLQPLRTLRSERGPLLMVLVAFLYSVTSTLGKVAIQHSSPAFMGVVYLPLVSVALLPLALRHGLRGSAPGSGVAVFLLIGLSQAFMTLCHFKAMSMVLVSYMIAVKRMSILLSVLFGAIFFREEHLKERLAGSLLMVLGVALIVL